MTESEMGRRPTRIAVVGAGFVGTTFAYALMQSRVAAEIVLIDLNRQKAEGEAMDLTHAMPFTHTSRIWAGTYEDCAGADVVVISAGANQKPGETRIDLVRRNVEIMRSIIPEIMKHLRNGFLVLATNPVDIITYVSLKLSGLPPERVIGSGTILDTGRFRYLLGSYFGIDPRSVHAYIIGEHGDTEVPVWSAASVAGMKLHEFAERTGIPCSDADMDAIFEQVRTAAYQIIERKGATYYAIGSALVRLVEAIIFNQRTVLSVSSLLTGQYGVEDICLSLPSIIGSHGIEHVLPLPLSENERVKFAHSADVLRNIARTVGF